MCNQPNKVRKAIIIFSNIFSSQNKQNLHEISKNLHKVVATKHLIESNKQNLHKIGCNQPNKINPQTIKQKQINIKKKL